VLFIDVNCFVQMKDDYLLSTNGKIGYFWEVEAMDNDGNLLFSKHNSLNKIGHGKKAIRFVSSIA